jgi:hypothetical protein
MVGLRCRLQISVARYNSFDGETRFSLFNLLNGRFNGARFSFHIGPQISQMNADLNHRIEGRTGFPLFVRSVSICEICGPNFSFALSSAVEDHNHQCINRHLSGSAS